MNLTRDPTPEFGQCRFAKTNVPVSVRSISTDDPLPQKDRHVFGKGANVWLVVDELVQWLLSRWESL